MKRILLSVAACLFLWTTAVSAQQQGKILKLETTEGEIFYFRIATQDPSFNCQHSIMEITWADGRLEFSRDQVKQMVLEEPNAQGIERTTSNADGIEFQLKPNYQLCVSGLHGGDRLQVVSLSGQTILNTRSTADGQQTVDLSQQPCGTYIVSVNKKYSFKLMKR